MYACRSVSVACRPAEKRRRRGEIGSIHRSILVGHRRPNRPQGVKWARKVSGVQIVRVAVTSGKIFTEIYVCSRYFFGLPALKIYNLSWGFDSDFAKSEQPTTSLDQPPKGRFVCLHVFICSSGDVSFQEFNLIMTELHDHCVNLCWKLNDSLLNSILHSQPLFKTLLDFTRSI